MNPSIRRAFAAHVIAIMASSCASSPHVNQEMDARSAVFVCTDRTTPEFTMDRAAILGIFGKPDVIYSRKTAEMAVEMDLVEINARLKGVEVFVYFSEKSATEHLCFGFKDGILIDVGYIDFLGTTGKAGRRTEVALHEACAASWLKRRRDADPNNILKESK